MKSSPILRSRFPEHDSALFRNKSFGALDEIIAPTPVRKASYDLRFTKQARPIPSRSSSTRNLTRSCPDEPHFGVAEQELVTILSRENSCENIAALEVPPIVAVSPPSAIPLRTTNPMIRNDRFNSSIDEYTVEAQLPTKKTMYTPMRTASASQSKQRSMSWPTPAASVEVGFLPPVVVEVGAGAAAY